MAAVTAGLDVQDSSLAPVSRPSVSTPSVSALSLVSAPPLGSALPVSVPEEIDVQPAKFPGLIEPLPHSSVVWTQTLKLAEEKLRDKKLPPLGTLELTSDPAKENIGAVISSLNAMREDKQNKQWSYTTSDGRKIIFVERLGEILRSMEPYTKIVDTMIQHDPQVSALVWGGIQAIIQVRIQFTIGIVGS